MVAAPPVFVGITLALAAAFAAPLAGQARPLTVSVRSEHAFEAAVSALRDSGGTIVLLPHAYRELVVSARSPRPLRIVGARGVRVEHMLLDQTQHVALGRVTIAPLGQNASIDVRASTHVDLHDLSVTAQGTQYAASVVVPDSIGVTIRRTTFTHCGDRSPSWSNCLLLGKWSRHVIVADNWFHDCRGCDFIHGRFGSDLTIRGNRFERTLPCAINHIRCGHQDPIEMFGGQRLRIENNHFGVYEIGGAQLYLTGPIDHVTIVNNLFTGTDPRVPGYRSRVGVIVGSSGSRRLPRDVTVVNNTILTGARRADGFLGSIRISSRYGGIPRRDRPLIVNNVIGVLERVWPVCRAARAAISNVFVRGKTCSSSDRAGPARLDPAGRPTAGSRLLIDAADRRYAPARDMTGRLRGAAPDIGAYEYRGG